MPLHRDSPLPDGLAFEEAELKPGGNSKQYLLLVPFMVPVVAEERSCHHSQKHSGSELVARAGHIPDVVGTSWWPVAVVEGVQGRKEPESSWPALVEEQLVLELGKQLEDPMEDLDIAGDDTHPAGIAVQWDQDILLQMG